MGTSVLPVLVYGIADIHEEIVAEYWREKKVRDGDWGEVPMNCELKCYLVNEAELLKNSITSVANE